MKKTTTKTAKASPAPATKAALAAKPAAKKKTAAPAVKPVVAKNHVTTIIAQIDIGFGNQLHIRGDGPGLSWDKGLLMDCVADDKWRVVLSESARPIVFKFLVNDLSWNAGEDYTTAPGANVTIAPTF